MFDFSVPDALVPGNKQLSEMSGSVPCFHTERACFWGRLGLMAA